VIVIRVLTQIPFMARDILRELVERFALSMPQDRRYINYIPPVDTWEHSLWLTRNDPVERLIVSTQKQRGRNGSLAAGLGALRGDRLPDDGADDNERATWFCENLSGRPVRLNFSDRRSVGRRRVPNYRSLKLGNIYLHSESIEVLNRWTGPDNTRSVHRFNLFIPRAISPRGTNVYGDHIIVEQPIKESFRSRYGWRCWVARIYDEENPNSKRGMIKELERETVLESLFQVDGFSSVLTNSQFPFLINWHADASGIRLPGIDRIGI